MSVLPQYSVNLTDHANTSLTAAISSFVVLATGWLIGFCGGLMICYFLWKAKNLRKPVNWLVFNMTIVALLTSVTCVPLACCLVLHEALNIHFANEYNTAIILITLHFLYVTFTSVQLLTLVCISYERFRAIARPFHGSAFSRHMSKTMALTWLISVPNGLGYALSEAKHLKRGTHRLHFVLYDNVFLVVVFLPFCSVSLLTIIILYSWIYHLIRQYVRIKRNSAMRIADSQSQAPTTKKYNIGRNLLCCSTEILPIVSTMPRVDSPTESSGKGINIEAEKHQMGIAVSMEAKYIRGTGQAGTSQSTSVMASIETISNQRSPSTQNRSGAKGKGHTSVPSQFTGRALTSRNQWLVVSETIPAIHESQSCVTVTDPARSMDATTDRAVKEFCPTEAGRRHIEVKMAKLAGLVIVVFVSLWLPNQVDIVYNFRRNNVMSRPSGEARLGAHDEVTTQVLAVVAVLITPVLFVVLSSDFRKEFKALFLSTAERR